VSTQVADLREITVATQGWQGGLNIRDAIDELQPNELWRAENVVYDNAGGVAKRRGCRSQGTFGAVADRVLSCYTFYRPGSNPQVLIHTSAGAVLYTNDVTANPITWATVVASGLSTTRPAAFETMNSNCYFAEGTLLGQWTGTTYTQISAAPANIYFLRSWKDTMWATTTASNDRVYSSAAGDPTTWPAANWVDILHGDGDQVTALATDGLFLIVAKRRRVQVIYDPATFANRTADMEKGAESHFGFQHLEDRLYYLSRLGICEWEGDTSARLISYKIDPLFTPLILNIGALANVMSYNINGRCGWLLPEVNSSVPTLLIEYYPRLGPIYQISGNIGPGPWTMHRLPAMSFTVVRQGSTDGVYGGHVSANKFMWFFSPDGTDDGTAFNSTLEAAAINFGNPVLWKYFRRVTVVGRGKFTLQFKRNYTSGIYRSKAVVLGAAATNVWGNGGVLDPKWNTGTWGPDSDIKRLQLGTDLYAVALSICVTDSETTTGTQIFPLGSKDAYLSLGAWALFQVAFDGNLLGLRG